MAMPYSYWVVPPPLPVILIGPLTVRQLRPGGTGLWRCGVGACDVNVDAGGIIIADGAGVAGDLEGAAAPDGDGRVVLDVHAIFEVAAADGRAVQGHAAGPALDLPAGDDVHAGAVAAAVAAGAGEGDGTAWVASIGPGPSSPDSISPRSSMP